MQGWIKERVDPGVASDGGRRSEAASGVASPAVISEVHFLWREGEATAEAPSTHARLCSADD